MFVYWADVRAESYKLPSHRQCVDVGCDLKPSYETANKKRKCFVIGPIGEPGSDDFENMEYLIDKILNPILNKFACDVTASHRLRKTGSITEQITKEIIESDIVISNLSTLNSNVLYETGIADAIGAPIIRIMQHGTKLPFRHFWIKNNSF